MLEQMRRQGASIFIYAIFGILIAVFVINFGPQNKGHESGGCTGTSNTALTVDNSTASFTSFRVAYGANGARGKAKTYVALEALIRRELLADAARSLGFQTNAEMALEEIKQDRFFFAGHRERGGWFTGHGCTPEKHCPPDVAAKVGVEYAYDEAKLAGFVSGLNVSRSAFLEEQAKGLLANLVEDLWSGSVLVSRDEAREHWLFENTTVTYDAVAFHPEAYRSAMRLTDADVERFVAAHEPVVKARFAVHEREYKGVKPQLHLRQIFIAKTDDATKKKLEDTRAQIVAGKLKLADAARELSTDEASKASGGDIGWHTADSPMLADKALNDAVKKLAPNGEPTPVVTTDRGVYLVAADGKREGDLAFDQVKLELARDVAKDEWSKEKARRDAEAALADARAGKGKNLAEIYPPEATAPMPPRGPQLTPEQRRRIEEQLRKQMEENPSESNEPTGSGERHGMLERAPVIETWSKDQPAGWFADDETTGSAAGSAASAGSGAGSAVPSPAPTPPPVQDYSKDQLPSFGDVAKPHTEHIGPITHQLALPGLGSNKNGSSALFDELSPGMLAKQVYDADGGYTIVQLLGRSSPDAKDFDAQADWIINEPCHYVKGFNPITGQEQDELRCGLRAKRARALLQQWIKERCDDLSKEGKIRPDEQLLIESDDNGNRVRSAYQPCSIAPQL